MSEINTCNFNIHTPKEDVYQFVKDNIHSYFRTIKAYHKELYEVVNALSGKNFGQKMYNYIHGPAPKCTCGVELSFINVNDGYKTQCKTCYEYHRKRKELWGPPPKCANPVCENAAFGENTNYGGWNLHCSLKCRGVHNSVKSREKTKQVWMEKYGVEHHRKSDMSKLKMKNTLKERYGVEHLMHIDGVSEKIKSTNMERYGVECVLSNDDIKEKIKNTCIEKYGAVNPSQNIEVHKKKLRSQKTYQLKNGEIINLQGYEPFFLDHFQQVMDVDSTIIDVPTINYMGNDGQVGVYFPDFIVKQYNTVIEIKSDYTMQFKEQIYNKIIGAVCAGYEVVLYVYSENGEVNASFYFNERIIEMMSSIGYDDTFVKCGDTYSQYVKGGVSINFVHGLFVCELFNGVNGNKKSHDILSQHYDCLFFTHDMVNNRGQQVYNYIYNKFNYGNKIYARQCEVKELTFKQADVFLESHHLQGSLSSGEHYGLYREDELMAVMSFSKPRLGVGKQRDGYYELTRFCSKGRVIGGASKLLRHFTSLKNGVKILSYSDNSYSNGDLYKTLGFELSNIVVPRYKYIKVGSDVMEPRFKYAKFKLKEMSHYDEILSEKEIMGLEGYVRVYDYGKKSWTLDV